MKQIKKLSIMATLMSILALHAPLQAGILDDIGKGFKKVGDGIKSGAETVGGAIVTGAKATADWTKGAAESVAKFGEDAYITVKNIVIGAIEVTTGVIAVITSIKPMIGHITRAIDDVEKGITGTITEVKGYANAKNPLNVLDNTFNIGDYMVVAGSSFLPALLHLSKTTEILGRKVIKPFDSSAGYDTMGAAQDMSKVHTDVDELVTNMKTTLPLLKGELTGINNQVEKAIKIINDANF